MKKSKEIPYSYFKTISPADMNHKLISWVKTHSLHVIHYIKSNKHHYKFNHSTDSSDSLYLPIYSLCCDPANHPHKKKLKQKREQDENISTRPIIHVITHTWHCCHVTCRPSTLCHVTRHGAKSEKVTTKGLFCLSPYFLFGNKQEGIIMNGIGVMFLFLSIWIR